MIFLFWSGFILMVILLLAMDLGVFHKKEHVIKAKEAMLWTVFWISLALLFDVFIYFAYEHHWLGIGLNSSDIQSGFDAALTYLTGYLIEESLSLDNIFVIALILSYFHVPGKYQHRVLFWGIMGALVMRGIMILAGIALIRKFVWMIYVFGVLLIITALKMLVSEQEKMEPEKNILFRIARKLYPVSSDFVGHNFFTRINGRRAITPLFLVLLVIESTDVLFAVDSIPAIFAVTTDPFIVYTSNVFAILGLRSLYFALAAMMNKFQYIKYSLVFILLYVGMKMLLSHTFKIPTWISLSVIGCFLAAGIVFSILRDKQKTAK